MGLFDKMFGHGAEAAQRQPNAEQRFNELRQKYETVLTTGDHQHIQFQNLHVQDDKLYIKGTAPSEKAKNKFWEQIKLVNPKLDDISADIDISQSRAQGVAVGGSSQGSQTYTIKAGDTLSEVSKQFYGDPNQYMRIFYINRDKLRDPDKIRVGQELTIPKG
jgi:nucleoid-associated protein YgaU